MFGIKTASLFALAVVLALATGPLSAALIVPTSVQGHNLQGGGGISSVLDQDEIDPKPDANDPSTWTATARAWQNDWQGNGPLDFNTYGKVGWATFDFGTVTALDRIFIWNVREATAPNRRVNTYNIWYSNAPTVTPVSGNGNAAASLNYDFTSGGWTQLGGTRSLTAATNGPDLANGVETLGVSAQYIGLEFITYGGDANRVGLGEVVFTVVPEPASLAGGLIGLTLIAARRRR